MSNEKQDEIDQMIKKVLKGVNANDKPPIILSDKDLDMIIDYTYYTLKMNINLNKINNNNYYQSKTVTQSLKKSQVSTPSETTQTNLIEIDPEKNNINITDNDLDKYIKQAEKYILTINRKTVDSLEKDQQLNINELLLHLPPINNKNNNINENTLLISNSEMCKSISPFEFIKYLLILLF